MNVPARGRAVTAPAPLLFLLFLVLLPSALAAQRRDTVQIRDTLAADTAVADTVPPALLVPLRAPPSPSFAHGVWRWDHEALLRSRAVSLADLLADIPGVAVFRTGLYLQPEAASAFGATAGGVELEIDGWVLDPLGAPVLDLTRFPLAELDAVTVMRGIDGVLRVRAHTIEASDARAYSRVEAATGEPNANLFRGMLIVPRFLVGPFGVAIERVDTDGLGGSEPADGFAGWLKWGWTGEDRGVQLELRQMSMKREEASPWVSNYSRRDVVVRARNRFLPALVAEAYAGITTLELEGPEDTSPPPEPPFALPDDGAIERSAFQGGGRIGWETGSGSIEAALRLRDRADLPRVDAAIDAAFSPLNGRLALRGRLDRESWSGASATRIDLGASMAPLPWLRVFGEWGNGTHAAPSYGRTGDGPLLTDRSGYRAGAELSWRGFFLGGALASVQTDSVSVFGLPFDSTFRRFPGGDVRGLEVEGRIPVFADWLTFEGSFVRWLEGNRWAYLPAAIGTAALELHLLPLPSGNLEVLARGEVVHRGLTAVPDTAAAEGGFLTTTPERYVVNADLLIRIMSVQAFLRYEDLSNKDPFDIPLRLIGGPRILYGVKWYFWN
jgi:hypothetical protein